jgi:hypothetical protein
MNFLTLMAIQNMTCSPGSIPVGFKVIEVAISVINLEFLRMRDSGKKSLEFKPFLIGHTQYVFGTKCQEKTSPLS